MILFQEKWEGDNDCLFTRMSFIAFHPGCIGAFVFCLSFLYYIPYRIVFLFFVTFAFAFDRFFVCWSRMALILRKKEYHGLLKCACNFDFFYYGIVFMGLVIWSFNLSGDQKS